MLSRAIACILASLGAALSPATTPAEGAALDVPYVEQGELLCGGAAVAMCMRYHGAFDVHARDFEDLVDPAAAGIYTSDLVGAVRARGFRVRELVGGPDLLTRLSPRVGPFVALLSPSSSRFHYVVVTAFDGDVVTTHDPATGPLRTWILQSFLERWRRSGFWAMTIEPDESRATSPERPPARSSSPATESAERHLVAVTAAHPERSGPWRELAGLRFRQQRWNEAAEAARRACVLEPADRDTRDLLAASLYLGGDTGAALDAWNTIARPRVDLVQAPRTGLHHRVITDMTGLQIGHVLTRDDLGVARRRVGSIPAVDAASISLDFNPDRSTVLNIRTRERSADFRRTAARAALGALAEHRVEVDWPSPTTNGGEIGVIWGFRPLRPLLQLAARAAAPFGVPVVARVSGEWSERSFRPDGAARTSRETLRRGALSIGHWFTPSLLGDAGLSLNRLDDTLYAGMQTAMETRWFDDRSALRLGVELWQGETDRFLAATLQGVARARSAGRSTELVGRAGLDLVERSAPQTLWGGVGTGDAGTGLLRAHPLLDAEGSVTGPGFGPALAYLGADLTRWLFSPSGLVDLGVAGFVDSAWVDPGPDPDWWLDAGMGLRLRLPAGLGSLALDAAQGLRDDAFALSLRWAPRWPLWSYDVRQ